jgi:glycosyltransferase involved in cell wall biosynthesis
MALAVPPGIDHPWGHVVRITYVTETYPPEVNGVALTVARTVSHLRQAGHDVDLIRPRQRHERRQADDQQWITHGFPIPMYPELRFGWVRHAAMVARLQRCQPDVVHVATPGPLGRTAVLAARAQGLPVTVDFRTNFHEYSRYYRLGGLLPVIRHHLRLLARAADLTFVPTEGLRQTLLEQGFERLEVVGRGVDAQAFSPRWRDGRLRAQWGADVHTPVVLYVGRLAAEKNVALAFQAWERARALCPETRMVVVGDGPLRAGLQRRWPQACFMGTLRGPALARAYASADVFAFPSLSETFGNVTLEAMASGLCTVAFKAAAAGVLIEDGRNGRVVPPEQPDAFLDAVCQACTALPSLGPLRAEARQRARMSDWNEVMRRFAGHLQDLVHQREVGHARDTCLV